MFLFIKLNSVIYKISCSVKAKFTDQIFLKPLLLRIVFKVRATIISSEVKSVRIFVENIL